MGALILPASGLIYVDAQIAIYSTDIHPVYAPLCEPIWKLGGTATVVSSELILLETLVGPLRSGDIGLGDRREALWHQPDTRLLPITQDILREAAHLRASLPGIKTPDAIHAATGLVHGCVLFVTNDMAFRRVTGLTVAVLDDLRAP